MSKGPCFCYGQSLESTSFPLVERATFFRWLKDKLGGASPYLRLIPRTHWIRTDLINAYGLMLLSMTFQTLTEQKLLYNIATSKVPRSATARRTAAHGGNT